MVNNLFYILFIIAFTLLCSCAHNPGTPPNPNVKLWAGDSSNAGITHGQTNETIYAIEPVFDKYVCMTYDDLDHLINSYVNSCELWDKQAKIYYKKLQACGLITKKNIEIINSCINNK